jgi:hypothetical protein
MQCGVSGTNGVSYESENLEGCLLAATTHNRKLLLIGANVCARWHYQGNISEGYVEKSEVEDLHDKWAYLVSERNEL